MKDLVLPASQYRDGVTRFAPLITVHLTRTTISVTLGDDREAKPLVTRLWSHTVWEMEHMGLALSFVATGKMPEEILVSTRELIIGGTEASIWPAAKLSLGMPLWSLPGRGTAIYCSYVRLNTRRLDTVFIDAVNTNGAASGSVSLEDACKFGEHIYNEAKRLCPKFVGPVLPLDGV